MLSNSPSHDLNAFTLHEMFSKEPYDSISGQMPFLLTPRTILQILVEIEPGQPTTSMSAERRCSARV